MISPEDPIYIDPRTSCTKDEAIAKLLGWMQGDIRHRHIEMTLEGVPAESLMHMPCFEGSIWDFLTAQRQDAQFALQMSLDDNTEFQTIDRLVEKISDLKETIIKAKKYQREIDDELAKGSESALKIDEFQSGSTGGTHISIKTLDQWAIQKYGISVLDFSKSTFLETDIGGTQITDVSVPGPVSSAPLSVVEDDVNESDVEGELSKTVAKNLYITFSLLLDDFISHHGGTYRHADGRPNIANIVKYIQDLAAKTTESSKGIGKLPGQGTRTLQTHVIKAIATKREALK